ncbi:hypothetical protein QQF64_031198 [Cirrhinus molitorella]|uniref:Uncharacterized protein n=1 Tax=Cirrhinus molitorella TaxID=172907 RepID=A0ABR3MW93_9TELE
MRACWMISVLTPVNHSRASRVRSRSATSARSGIRPRFLSLWPTSRREHSGALSGCSSASFLLLLLTFSSRRSGYASYRRTIRGTGRAGTRRSDGSGSDSLSRPLEYSGCITEMRAPRASSLVNSRSLSCQVKYSPECGFTCFTCTGARCADACVTFCLRCRRSRLTPGGGGTRAALGEEGLKRLRIDCEVLDDGKTIRGSVWVPSYLARCVFYCGKARFNFSRTHQARSVLSGIGFAAEDRVQV